MAVTPTQGYANVGDIVKSTIYDMGYNTLHLFPQFLHYALEGVNDFMMDDAQDVKTITITPDAVNQVALPADYINWVKIGITKGDRIAVFVHDSSINFNNDGSTENEPFTDANDWPYVYSLINIVNPLGFTGEIRGYGWGHNGLGYFRVDNKNRKITFSSEIPSDETFYLEYIYNGFSSTTKSVVNAMGAKLIKYYIRWKNAIQKFGVRSAEAKEWEFQYEWERKKVRGRMSDLTYEGILDVTSRHTHQQP